MKHFVVNVCVFFTGGVLFFGGAAIMMLLMIRLSFMWSKLLKKWTEIEYHFGYQKNLKRVFAIISSLIIVFSTGDFLFKKYNKMK